MSTPYTPTAFQNIEIWVPAGTEYVRRHEAEISGRWVQQLQNFTGLRRGLLLEDFVNWSSNADEVVRFTQMYGPLDSEANGGEEFSFSVEHWKRVQSHFRSLWEGRARRSVSTTLSGSPYQISIQNERLMFHAKTLEAYLFMELATAPAMRLRKCLRPECPHPYFVARHLNQQYCSSPCAEWAQAQWKKHWWEDKGSSWLGDRRKRSGRKPRKAKKG